MSITQVQQDRWVCDTETCPNSVIVVASGQPHGWSVSGDSTYCTGCTEDRSAARAFLSGAYRTIQEMLTDISDHRDVGGVDRFSDELSIARDTLSEILREEFDQ